MKIIEKLKRAKQYIFHGIPNNIVRVVYAKTEYGKRLEGKKVLITGGSKGIGLAISKRLIEEGAIVTVTSRDIKNLEMTKKEIDSDKYFMIEHDIRRIDEAQGMIYQARKLMGGIDVLINNAGVSVHDITCQTCSEEEWDYQIDTNLKGTYFVTQAFLHYYEEVKKSNGKIINMVSERGLCGDDVPYGLSKRALISFTEGLAVKLIRKGIRVYAVAPGVTATDMTGHDPNGDLYRKYAKGRRILLPEEIAEVVTFLISDSSNCISGQVLVCNEANHLN